VRPGEEVYEGRIVGASNRSGDLAVNVCRTKKLTNVRSSNKELAVQIAPPRILSLEEALEFLEGDELLEVTPGALPLRKRALRASLRKRG
jgi:GTP-binding protein